MSTVHTFPVSIAWAGSTQTTSYSRDAAATAPNKHAIEVSSAPAYAGNGNRWNPEDMLATSLATCHMLTFLALASKASVDVQHYLDNAVATMELRDKVMQVTTIELNAKITVAAGSDEAKVRELFTKAHTLCFIANSIKCAVKMNPTVVLA
jgi:organic hydroperoxide reductase OsmC/OhrA